MRRKRERRRRRKGRRRRSSIWRNEGAGGGWGNMGRKEADIMIMVYLSTCRSVRSDQRPLLGGRNLGQGTVGDLIISSHRVTSYFDLLKT